jgi:5'-AMP-activated protein kinase regulatory beta subunit
MQQMGWGSAPPAGLDDNSILAVPNHVVLNHLTASAIKNGTLGVGTTTRYRKKVGSPLILERGLV